jgi:hypothetical protein
VIQAKDLSCFVKRVSSKPLHHRDLFCIHDNCDNRDNRNDSLCKIDHDSHEIAINAERKNIAIIAIITANRKQWLYFMKN